MLVQKQIDLLYEGSPIEFTKSELDALEAGSYKDLAEQITERFPEFKDIIDSGGFIRCGWDGSDETESKIKEETKATIRCIPFDENPKNLNCIYSGGPAKHEVIYAKAY